jgi:site-specific recombinase XerD
MAAWCILPAIWRIGDIWSFASLRAALIQSSITSTLDKGFHFVDTRKAHCPVCRGFKAIGEGKLSTKMMTDGKMGTLAGAAHDSVRMHLTSRDVEKLIEAMKDGRNEARDRCLLLLMFRHGLRVSEACRMKLDQVDTEARSAPPLFAHDSLNSRIVFALWHRLQRVRRLSRSSRRSGLCSIGI